MSLNTKFDESVRNKNLEIQNLRKYHSALININSLKTLVSSGDVENLSRFVRLIECENTITGKFK